jgi:hypothetical protein
VTIRELTTDEWVHRVIDFMFTKQNAENFDTSWTDVLERREDIRVTLSTLLHETNESIISIKRTMLSWYVDILNDHELIENMRIETWIELIATHRDLIDESDKSRVIIRRFSRTKTMKHISDTSWTRFMTERRFKWRLISKSSVQMKKTSSSWNTDDVSACEASKEERVWVEIVLSTQKRSKWQSHFSHYRRRWSQKE